jgi:hypothetical protein
VSVVRLTGRLSARLAGRSPARDGLAFAVVALLAATYAYSFIVAKPGEAGRDLALYQREVLAWLGGAPMYPPFEVQGGFTVVDGVILYPPITIALFAPTLLLPLPFWWLIPVAIVATVVYRLRPGGRWLLAMGLCLLFPVSVNLVVAGNPDMWLAAALAVAVRWRPAAAFVLLKPSVFPFALVGLRSRGWWAVVGVFAAVSLFLLPQTLDWIAVLRNSQGGSVIGREVGFLYSMWDVPLLAVPLLAWAGSTRRESAGSPQDGATAEGQPRTDGPVRQ